MFRTIQSAALVSWKSTAAAIGTLLALWGPALEVLFDGDAATNPDWNLIIAGTVAAIGLIASKDADKSSEDHVPKKHRLKPN